jgi:hypothetical protein
LRTLRSITPSPGGRRLPQSPLIPPEQIEFAEDVTGLFL